MSKETLKQNCANIASQKFLMMQKSVPIAVKANTKWLPYRHYRYCCTVYFDWCRGWFFQFLQPRCEQLRSRQFRCLFRFFHPSTPTVTHAPSVYSIGDTAESNGVKVTLVNAETGHGSQYLTPSAGNIFVTLEFEIENDSSSDINVSSIASFEAYCDDYSVTESITAVALSDKSTLDGNVAAGKR